MNKTTQKLHVNVVRMTQKACLILNLRKDTEDCKNERVETLEPMCIEGDCLVGMKDGVCGELDRIR